MWPALIAKAKAGGLDVIQTYVFWNVHEPVKGQVNALSISIWVRGTCQKNMRNISINEWLKTNTISFHQYNFMGRYDLVKFIKAIQAQGLYVSLRIGPFIEAEWKYGYEWMKNKHFLCTDWLYAFLKQCSELTQVMDSAYNWTIFFFYLSIQRHVVNPLACSRGKKENNVLKSIISQTKFLKKEA